jgi:hypothetical protein
MTKKRSVVFNAITAEQFHRSFNLEGPGYLIAVGEPGAGGHSFALLSPT